MATKWRRWAAPVGILAALIFGPGFYQMVRLAMMEWRLDRRLAALAGEQDARTQEHERLTKDATYVEGLIRTTFKVAKPGEYVIALPKQRR